MTKRLEGRVVLLTGAARGIGAEAARQCAIEGASVMLADLRDDMGSALAEDIATTGAQAAYHHCDVTDNHSVADLVRATVDRFGAIDVLVNNAGTAIAGKVDELSEEDWDRTFAVNVKSMFLCTKHVVPIMRQAGGGVIVNMASESGLIGFPMHPAYCASKAAVINLTRSLATGHAADGIRANCICPGTIPTPLYREFMDSLPDKEAVEQELERTHPLGLGSERDIARGIVFLACDDSRYMTGSPLIMDGGLTAI